ncbi:hypothetical protein ACOSQ4_032196 [Xanthoceras sorbifolium]
MQRDLTSAVQPPLFSLHRTAPCPAPTTATFLPPLHHASPAARSLVGPLHSVRSPPALRSLAPCAQLARYPPALRLLALCAPLAHLLHPACSPPTPSPVAHTPQESPASSTTLVPEASSPSQDKITTPYGSSKSPIIADVVLGASKRLGGTAIDGHDHLFWLES